MSSSNRTKHHLTFPVALLLTLFLTVTSAQAADWPSFRNSASNAGASTETINIPLVEQWHSTAPDVEENGVVVANKIAYMLSEEGKLYAFNVTTGFEVPGFPVNTTATYSTPAVDIANNRIYVLAGSTLWAFNLDGTSAWTQSVGGTGSNYSQGPVIDSGFVYFKAGGNLLKYDAAGALQWIKSTSGNNTQPAIMGDFVYVNSESGQIRKYDKATGVEVIGGGFPITTTAQQASLTAINGKLFFKSDQLYAYSAADGSLLWSPQLIDGNATYYGSPAVAGGAVYVFGWDGRLYAFNENTGATLAGFPSVVLSTSGDRNWSSPAVAGDKVFVGAGTSQKLKVLGAAGTAQAGQVLAEYLTFSNDPQGFDLCSPAVSDGYVFAMLDGGGLYAFFGGGGTAPTGALTINGGTNCTNSTVVTLTLSNNNNANVTDMRISEDPFFAGAPWIPYQQTSSFTFSAGFGTKTVYAQLKDNQGLLSNVFTDQIDYKSSCATPRICDVDIDSDIDKLDLSDISKARGQIALPGDPRDANLDGKIDPRDVKVCIPLCTRPQCAVQ